MPVEVIMPKVDMVMETGTFVEWLKQEGDHVEKGDPLFVILTDKANIEIDSPGSGVLAGIKARPDDVIPVAQTIAYILAPGESLPATAALPQPTGPALAARATVAPAAPEPVLPTGSNGGKVRATPIARRLAANLGIDLATLTGRGPLGRVHKADVLAFAEHRPETRPAPAVPAGQPAAVVPEPAAQPAAVAQRIVAAPTAQVPLPDARQKAVVPLTGPRKVIAERMAQSAFTAPHITESLHVDMSEAARLRSRLLDPLQARTGQRLSFTAIVARAVATLLPLHPYLNASLVEDKIILWEDVHLGIATSVEDYLIVPVIREAQNKNLEQIVVAMADLTERGRNRRLKPAEMAGSTFTISNLGMFGVESFTAIINPPEAGILAVGKIVDTPVGEDGKVVLKPLLSLTLSADHRIVDGVTAARFLAELKATLENPYLLI